jgi:hypothetical protein
MLPTMAWMIIGVILGLIVIIAITLIVVYNGGCGLLTTKAREISSDLVRKVKQTSRTRVAPVESDQHLRTRGDGNNSVVVTDDEISKANNEYPSLEQRPKTNRPTIQHLEFSGR